MDHTNISRFLIERERVRSRERERERVCVCTCSTLVCVCVCVYTSSSLYVRVCVFIYTYSTFLERFRKVPGTSRKLHTEGSGIFLEGSGSSPEGTRRSRTTAAGSCPCVSDLVIFLRVRDRCPLEGLGRGRRDHGAAAGDELQHR